MVVERLEAQAWLRDPGDEVERVREQLRDGDESWARWLQELERGDAVVASMQVTVHVRLADGSCRTAKAENHHLWLEVGRHPPLLEAQIQEIAGKDFAALAQRLREFGEDMTADELSDMYLHVQLGDDLLAATDGAGPARPRTLHGPRQGVGTESGRHVVR